MSRLGFYFDIEMCIGCRTCQIACKDKNKLDVGVNFRKVSTFETGTYPNAIWYHYSGACNHCADAKCVSGCPTGAMYHAEDGTVQHDKEKCIGCKYCTWNCPYGVPQYLEESKVIGKCDTCQDLRSEGGNPACVDSCPMRCIKFGEIDELKKEYGSGLVNDLPILPKSSLTNPSLWVNPKKSALNPNFVEKEV